MKQASLAGKSGKLCKDAPPAIILLHKNICRPLTRSEILPHEFPFARSQRRHDCGASIETDSQVIGLHHFVGQSTRFDHFEKTRFVDNVSIRINDDPVVGEETSDCRPNKNKLTNDHRERGPLEGKGV